MYYKLSILPEHDIENNQQNFGSRFSAKFTDVSRRHFLINSRGNFQSLASGLSTLEVYFGVDRCENHGRSTIMVHVYPKGHRCSYSGVVSLPMG